MSSRRRVRRGRWLRPARNPDCTRGFWDCDGPVSELGLCAHTKRDDVAVVHTCATFLLEVRDGDRWRCRGCGREWNLGGNVTLG